jgi:hypothetical protein
VKNIKSHMEWAWIIIVAFFVLSIVDFRFGILGFICMGAPITQALKGNGKIHCVKYCPRGSFLGQVVDQLSLGYKMPKFMKNNRFKDGLLVLMVVLLTVSISHANGDYSKIAFAMFRFMGSSFIVGILMGILFKGRSWCVICPMGRATSKIQQVQVNIDLMTKKKKPLES